MNRWEEIALVIALSLSVWGFIGACFAHMRIDEIEKKK
jgi:hypothetical protein